jgi:hypothetical protein
MMERELNPPIAQAKNRGAFRMGLVGSTTVGARTLGSDIRDWAAAAIVEANDSNGISSR